MPRQTRTEPPSSHCLHRPEKLLKAPLATCFLSRKIQYPDSNPDLLHISLLLLAKRRYHNFTSIPLQPPLLSACHLVLCLPSGSMNLRGSLWEEEREDDLETTKMENGETRGCTSSGVAPRNPKKKKSVRTNETTRRR